MVLEENYREIIVTDLIKSMLGPKYGLYEVFPEKMNPWKLYLTGILAPEDAEPDEEGEKELDTFGISSNEEEADTEVVNNPIEYIASLESNSQPRSFGISFIVKTQDIPKFDICFTWARYLYNNNWQEIEKHFDKDQRLIGFDQKDLIQKNSQDEEQNNPNLEADIDISDYDSSTREKKKGKKKSVSNGGWKRSPRFLILKNIKLDSTKPELIINSNELLENDKKKFESSLRNFDRENFSVFIKWKKFEQNSNTKHIPFYFKISIYFINTSIFNSDDRVSNFIFQPQIRVNCVEDTLIEPYELTHENMATEITEDSTLKFLYHNKRTRGKGHMCSVIWKDIDPEREYIIDKFKFQEIYKKEKSPFWEDYKDVKLKRKIDSKFPPFYWVDGELLTPNDRKYFTSPDIRSEFVPIYPINSPIFDWRRISCENNKIKGEKVDNKEIKFLDPLYLAENCWEKSELEKCINELIVEYEKWINYKEKEIKTDVEENQEKSWATDIAKENMRKNAIILKRIREGLNCLLNDFDARISFCFANKVMYEQNNWKYKGKTHIQFYWRPFQIAFLLLSISGILDRTGQDRNIVDLIWFPTGGGKTEAYLLVAAFAFAYRRRRGIIENKRNRMEAGTVLISRYTLRLLTIQQFRRALSMILACEMLRVDGLKNSLNNNQMIGWLPRSLKVSLQNHENRNDLSDLKGWIWGTTRFSVGLWVGSALSPNRLETIKIRGGSPIYGAIDALKVKISGTHGEINVLQETGDPAQIMFCPVCKNILSFPKKEDQSLSQKPFTFYLMIEKANTSSVLLKKDLIDYFNNQGSSQLFQVNLHDVFEQAKDIYVLEIEIIPSEKISINIDYFARWWREVEKNVKDLKLLSTDIRNPGYFYLNDGNCNYDFEIRCCNPKCILNEYNWAEKVTISNNNRWTKIPTYWKSKGDVQISRGIPISAYTVDDQVYRRLPTLLVGTVDKFAQLSFKDDAGALFGNVDYFLPDYGFFRERTEQSICNEPISSKLGVKLDYPLDSPEIILQDELHLIEGPLGSLVGIYEMMIEELSKRYDKEGKIIQIPKYIASTATIKSGKDQINSLYLREMMVFPTQGISESDSFFLYFDEQFHPLEEAVTGRLYVGLCCPGKSAQAPLSHIWGSLFQSSFDLKRLIESIPSSDERIKKLKELDRFWTIVGYFNAMRELAGVRAIYNQEFISWMRLLYGIGNYRQIAERKDEPLELSSRTDSTLLPSYLEKLDVGIDEEEKATINGVLTTSMFGTGVDVARLGAMVINGQPKTTGAYIQSSGRIGRNGGGIVVTFYRAGRPRDLDHYEQFIGYHQAIHKYVEPVTVVPFAPDCAKTSIGPLFVALCRQSYQLKNELIGINWRKNDLGPKNIKNLNPIPSQSPLVDEFLKLFNNRLKNQPIQRKPNLDYIIDWFKGQCDYWRNIIDNNLELVYNEYTLQHPAEKSVVLGDPAHKTASITNPDINIVFDNAPNSLRGIEATTTFGRKITRSISLPPVKVRTQHGHSSKTTSKIQVKKKKSLDPIRGF